MDNIDFQLFYFSGTGNTILLVDRLIEILEQSGEKVLKRRIEDNPSVDTNTPIILTFPIACFSTYPLVWNFIKNIPESKTATKVSVFYDMAGRSFNFYSLLHKTFRKKGYAPQTLGIILMPSNIVKTLPPEEKQQNIIQNGEEEVAKFANNVISGVKNWKSKGIATGLYNRMIQNMNWYKTMKAWQPTLDESKCTKCGLCADLCPTKSIEMNDYPEHHDTCMICLRCIGVCPTKALSLGKTKSIPYLAVKPSRFKD